MSESHAKEQPIPERVDSLMRRCQSASFTERAGARKQLTALLTERDTLREALEQVERRIKDADSFLADPAGNPIDAINLARSALNKQQERKPVPGTWEALEREDERER